ncbi:MAG: hypothetical protein M3Z66_12640 [Chloroflexota bacterium]|nr:hypothetical protein [Chloroflexota bacterium]
MQSSMPQLKPTDVTGLLDTMFALYRRNLALFIGVVAVLQVPVAVIVFLLRLNSNPQLYTSYRSVGGSTATPTFHSDAIVVTAVSSVATLVVSFFITAALAQAISRRYLGESATLGQVYRSIGWSVIARLVAYTLLEIATVLVLTLIIGGITILLVQIAPALGGLFAVVASIAAVVALVIAFIRFAFVPQVLVLERTRVFQAFRRSWTLVYGSTWRVLGYLLLLSLIVAITGGILGGVAGAALTFTGGREGAALGGAIGAIAGILIEPIRAGGQTLLYYDLRIRKEGFDLERQVSTMESPGLA